MALSSKSKSSRGKVTFARFTLAQTDVSNDTVDATQSVQVAGARVGDVVAVSVTNETNLIVVNGYVASNGSITLQLVNLTGGVFQGTESADLTVFHRN